MAHDIGRTDLGDHSGFTTRAVRAGQQRSQFHETSEYLALTSGYTFATAAENAGTFAGEVEHYNYSRVDNPTTTMLCDRLAALDGAEAAWPVASGMAAIFYTVLALTRSGSRIVSSRELFGSTVGLFTLMEERFGVHVDYVAATDMREWERALSTPAALVFCETPSNPVMRLVDLAGVSALAHQAGALMVVDNTFATPVLQQPLRFGADVITYSTTKLMDGQGRTVGGAILGTESFIIDQVKPWTRCTGPTMSPFTAWTVLKGLETLPLRVQAQSNSARQIAQALEQHPNVEQVLHPDLPSHPQYDLAQQQMEGGGQMLSIVVSGGTRGAHAFLDRLSLIDISNNLGDTKSLAVHCATTTHHSLTPEEREVAGIPDGLVRLSIGLEDVHDLLDDITQALA
ncbi:trans-sulfuration enzyme family protein [Stomatohabitans albus]|uniref:trans-sulfuration enzyme family protein n=1 Tax=Stomatohabitans albus TaxID=3110766 RepID=UPI00300C7E80